MFTWYKEIRKLGAVFAEFPTEPGRRFMDAYREDGELFLWVGRFHMICSSARRIARQGISMAAAVLGLMWTETGAISLALPSIPKASAAALVAMTAAGAAVSDESLTTPVPVVESATWLLSPASDFPVVFVPEETASLSQ
jgi:hypothetical protein